MSVTTSRLTRAASLAAIAAGLLFILVQFIHPPDELASVATTGWMVTHAVTVLMAVLAVVGLSGVYLRQVERTGVLGLIGFLLFASAFLVIAGLTFVEAFVLPLLVDQAPQFVEDVLAISGGGEIAGDVAALEVANAASGVGYLLGGLLFGVAVHRAGVLARWAALLLAVGTVASILVPLLPHAFGRMAAVPVGLALAGLGHSLWQDQGAHGARSVPSACHVPVQLAIESQRAHPVHLQTSDGPVPGPRAG